MDACCCFLRDAFPGLGHLRPVTGALLGDAAQERLNDGDFMVFGGLVGPLVAFFEFGAFVDKKGHVAAVIDHELWAEIAGEGDRFEGEFPILFECLAFPGKDGRAGLCDGCGGVVLSGENVAARPAHIGAEVNQRLDENCCLDRHVERTSHAHAFERLLLGVFFTNRHEARHFMLGNADFLASPVGERDVGDNIIRALRRGGSIFGEISSRGGEFGQNCGGGCF